MIKLKENLQPRNVGWIIKTKNPLETSKIPLKYFAYGFGVLKPITFKKQSEFRKNSEWGFIVNPLTKTVKNLNEIEDQHKFIESRDEVRL